MPQESNPGERFAPMQEALFPAPPAPEPPQRARKPGRPRHDDAVPEREVSFITTLEQRRFLDRECRRLGLNRNELFARMVGLFEAYQQVNITPRR